ncbi:MAG: dihydrofolate reductase family protein [Bacteroidota bacterium]
MATLSVFIFTSLNGCTHDIDGDISWHVHGEEENEFASKSLSSHNILLFGRKTYEMMVSYWPTPMALEHDPKLAAQMNNAEKIVCSNTLRNAEWQNTKVIGGDIFQAIKDLKATSPHNITILGSNTLATQLAEQGLIDELQLMIDPVAIENGVSLFATLNRPLSFSIKDMHVMKSGVVLLNYTFNN